MASQALLFNLNAYYGLISLKGADATKFLQGILTCDINELDHKDHCFGAFCNLKGRIRSLFRIFKRNDAIFLTTPKDLIPVIIPVLKKHAMFSKVVISDASQELSIWGFVGDISLFPMQNSKEDSINVLMIEDKLPRYFVISDENALGSDLQNNTSIKKGDFETWKSLDIQSSIPEVWLETTEKFLPHHLNLPTLDAVSFTKGCYCGQEIIARMEYKGKIKYGLEHRSTQGDLPPLPGTEIDASAVVVTACTTSPGKIEMLVQSQLEGG